MKRLWSLFLLTLSFLLLIHIQQSKAQQTGHSIIPLPQTFEKGKGHFQMTSHTRVAIAPSSKELGRLAEYLKERLKITDERKALSGNESRRSKGTIVLELTDSITNEEGYSLTVDKKTITIRGRSGKGIFYGIQTLIQLLPPDIEATALPERSGSVKVPACRIVDYPRFPYRGMHLDVCRHFFPVGFIKKYIDLLAMYKINNFHWHLTEDQGWRLEIKKYPLLTEIGSVRSGTPVGRSLQNDNLPYGGFYTREEAREIVRYAASRYVNVIPEIEMPGHSLAALAAYPQFSCTGGPFSVWTRWGVSHDIYCAGKEETFAFLEDVLTEVMEIFPSRYIHIGGDEAPWTNWEQCALCQQRIKENGLKDEAELQSYFIRRIEAFLNKNNRQIIGWDEILEGGLAPGATVMSWRGTEGGIRAAGMGHQAIMTPGRPCYFDHYQGPPDHEPLAIGGYNPLISVYHYDPVPESLSKKESGFILGSQGNVWTEYIATEDHVEYMAFPRAIALAEVNWSDKKSRNWVSFTKRLNDHLVRLEKKDVNFSRSAFNALISVVRNPQSGNMSVKLASDIPRAEIHFSMDPGDNAAFRRYKGPFTLEKNSTIRAYLTVDGKRPGLIIQRTVYVHDAFGKLPVINTGFSEKYRAVGPLTLTDGCRAHPLALQEGWLGFHGNDADFVIDLGETTDIRNVNIGFLHNPGNWIFLPSGVEISLSTDGTTYRPAEGLKPELLTIREPMTVDFNQVQINAKARFIKVIARNRGVCPEGHPGAGEKAWLFLDEVMVNQPGD